MEELMRMGWSFEFQGNQLETFSCEARKGDIVVSAENFNWWSLVKDIVRKCDDIEEKGVLWKVENGKIV